MAKTLVALRKLRLGRHYSVIAVFLGIMAFVTGFFFSRIQARGTNPGNIQTNHLNASTPSNSLNASNVRSDQILGLLKGDATLIRSEKLYKLKKTQDRVTVILNDRIIITKGQTCLFKYPDGRMVKFSGEGEYRPQLNDIKIMRGGMVISFSSSPKGYKVKMPISTLGIRGTVIHVQLNKDQEDVWLAEGIMDWKNPSSQNSGILIPGEGIRFTKTSEAPLSESPLGVPETPVFEEEDLELGSPLASYPLCILVDDPNEDSGENPDESDPGTATIHNPFEDQNLEIAPQKK